MFTLEDRRNGELSDRSESICGAAEKQLIRRCHRETCGLLHSATLLPRFRYCLRPEPLSVPSWKIPLLSSQLADNSFICMPIMPMLDLHSCCTFRSTRAPSVFPEIALDVTRPFFSCLNCTSCPAAKAFSSQFTDVAADFQHTSCAYNPLVPRRITPSITRELPERVRHYVRLVEVARPCILGL